MIKSITITNHLQDSLKMVLTEPESSGFIIRSIEGLGPAKANIRTIDLVTLDGAIDNGAQLETRNIVLSLTFLGTPLIEDTRLKSYKYFPIKQNIKFEIETDRRHCYTIGRVETNEPNIFDQNEGCQISIICPDSYFKDMKDTIVNFDSIDSGFEFPFENESETPQIEFGAIKNDMYGNLFYEGDSEVGITFEIHSTGDARGLGIYRLDTLEMISISDAKLQSIVGEGIKSGDTIVISTVKGEKSVYLIRDGLYYNILNALNVPITWFTLHKGDNTFLLNATSGLSKLQYKISYRTLYEGV